MQQPDKRIRSPSPSTGSISNTHQDKRLRPENESHSNEEVVAASTLAQLSETSETLQGITRTFSELSFDNGDNESEGNPKTNYKINVFVNYVAFRLLLQIYTKINASIF